MDESDPDALTDGLAFRVTDGDKGRLVIDRFLT